LFDTFGSHPDRDGHGMPGPYGLQVSRHAGRMPVPRYRSAKLTVVNQDQGCAFSVEFVY